MAKRRRNGSNVDLAPVLLWGSLGIVGLTGFALLRRSKAKSEEDQAPPGGGPTTPPNTTPDTSELLQGGSDVQVTYVAEPLALEKTTTLTACSVWTVRWVADRGEWGQWDGPVNFSDQSDANGERILAAKLMVDYLAALGVTNEAPGFWYALGYRPTDVYTGKMTYHVTTGRFGDPLHVVTGWKHDGKVSEFLPQKGEDAFEALIA